MVSGAEVRRLKLYNLVRWLTAAWWWGEAWGSSSRIPARDSRGLLSVFTLNFKQSLHHFTFSSPFSVTLLHDNEPAPSEILMHHGYYHGYHHFIMKTDGFNITNDIQDFYEEVYDWRKGGSALTSRQSSFYRKEILHSLEFPWLWSVRIRQVKTTRNINTFWRKI